MTIKITNEQKHSFYVFLFTIFGLLLGVFIAGMTMVIYLMLLNQDFAAYSFGLSWEELNQFGQMLSLVLIVVCGLWGRASGKYWWTQIYVLKRFGQKN